MDTPETQQSVTESSNPAESTKLQSSSLREEIAKFIADISPTIRGMVVTELGQQEITKRKAAVLAVYEKIQSQRKEISKLEGQGSITYGLDGKPLGAPSFNKQQLEDIKKAKEQLGKLEKALFEAFENNSWQKLLELGNQKQNPQGGQAG